MRVLICLIGSALLAVGVAGCGGGISEGVPDHAELVLKPPSDGQDRMLQAVARLGRRGRTHVVHPGYGPPR